MAPLASLDAPQKSLLAPQTEQYCELLGPQGPDALWLRRGSVGSTGGAIAGCEVPVEPGWVALAEVLPGPSWAAVTGSLLLEILNVVVAVDAATSTYAGALMRFRWQVPPAEVLGGC